MSEPIYADADIRRRRSDRVPLGRLGRSEDVAAVVLFLLSTDSAATTGALIPVDAAG